MNQSPRTNIDGSIHPWYYVPGKIHLTEKRLSHKRNMDSRNYERNQANNKYFIQRNCEMKLYSNWEKNKPLVKYQPSKSCSQPNLFTDEPSGTAKELEQMAYRQTVNRMSQLMNEYYQTANTYAHSLVDCDAVLHYLSEYMKVYAVLFRKRHHFINETQRYLTKKSYHSVQDPLRQVCFMIKDILYYYKQQIVHISKLIKSVYGSNLLTKHEQSELDQLNHQCFQIMDMYLQLNNIRDEYFQQMYNEEREKAWSHQQQIWQQEITIWDRLIVKFFKSNYHLIHDKLECSLQRQKESLHTRLGKFEQVNNYANEISQDTALKPILYQKLSQFIEK